MHQDHHQRIGAHHETSAVVRAQLGIVAHSVMSQRRNPFKLKTAKMFLFGGKKKRGNSYLAPQAIAKCCKFSINSLKFGCDNRSPRFILTLVDGSAGLKTNF